MLVSLKRHKVDYRRVFGTPSYSRLSLCDLGGIDLS